MSSLVVLLKDKFTAVIEVLCTQTIKYGLYVCVSVCLHSLRIRYQKTHSFLGGDFYGPHNFKGRLRHDFKVFLGYGSYSQEMCLS